MIVITAPTSSIGSQLLKTVVDTGANVRVIARDPARLPAYLTGRIEIIQGSHSEKDVVNTAFEGADTVFWLVPADPHSPSIDAAYVDFSRPGAEALVRHGVKRVVNISALGRGTELVKHAGHVTASLKMDDLIASTGVHLRTLAMPGFIDNMLRQLEPLKTQGVFYWPMNGDRKVPTCATRDIAATAAKFLLDTTWTGQSQVPILGPEDLSFNEIAGIMTEVLGKPIRFQEIPAEALRARLIAGGHSEPMAQAMIDMLVAKDNGLDNAEPRTPEASTPTSFRQWCEEVLKPAYEAG